MHFVTQQRQDIFPKGACAVATTRLPSAVEVVNHEERITLTEIRRRLKPLLGKRPHVNTIHDAVLRGFPTEPHGLIKNRRVYPWLRCLAWIEREGKESVLPKQVQRAIKRRK